MIFKSEYEEIIENLTQENNRLRAFVNWMIGYMQEGGDMDGWTFQDTAQAHGILVETRPKEPCGSGCVCAEFYSAEEFQQGEARCNRRSTLVGGTEPAPPAPPAPCPICTMPMDDTDGGCIRHDPAEIAAHQKTGTLTQATCTACQGRGLAITGDHGAGCPECGKVG